MNKIIREFRKRYPEYDDWTDEQLWKNLKQPEKFKRAFPEYKDWADEVILKNLRRYEPVKLPSEISPKEIPVKETPSIREIETDRLSKELEHIYKISPAIKGLIKIEKDALGRETFRLTRPITELSEMQRADLSRVLGIINELKRRKIDAKIKKEVEKARYGKKSFIEKFAEAYTAGFTGGILRELMEKRERETYKGKTPAETTARTIAEILGYISPGGLYSGARKLSTIIGKGLSKKLKEELIKRASKKIVKKGVKTIVKPSKALDRLVTFIQSAVAYGAFPEAARKTAKALLTEEYKPKHIPFDVLKNAAITGTLGVVIDTAIGKIIKTHIRKKFIRNLLGLDKSKIDDKEIWKRYRILMKNVKNPKARNAIHKEFKKFIETGRRVISPEISKEISKDFNIITRLASQIPQKRIIAESIKFKNIPKLIKILEKQNLIKPEQTKSVMTAFISSIQPEIKPENIKKFKEDIIEGKEYKLINPETKEVTIITDDLYKQVLNKKLTEIRPELREPMRRSLLSLASELHDWEFQPRIPAYDPETGKADLDQWIAGYTTRPSWVRPNWTSTKKNEYIKKIDDILKGKEQIHNPIVRYLKETALFRLVSGDIEGLAGVPISELSPELKAEVEEIIKKAEEGLKERRIEHLDTSKIDNQIQDIANRLKKVMNKMETEGETPALVKQATELIQKSEILEKKKKNLIESWTKSQKKLYIINKEEANKKLFEKYSQVPTKRAQRVLNTKEYSLDDKLDTLNGFYKDPLTGLFNRQFYFDYGNTTGKSPIDMKIEETKLFHEPQTILDMDNFKQINEKYGHDVGDVALKILGKVIELEIPHTGIRYGGDEIILPLEGRTLKEQLEILKRIRERLKKEIIKVGDKVYSDIELNFTSGTGIDFKSADNRLREGKHKFGKGKDYFDKEVIKYEGKKGMGMDTAGVRDRIRHEHIPTDRDKGVLRPETTEGRAGPETTPSARMDKEKIPTHLRETIRPSQRQETRGLGIVSPGSQFLFELEHAYDDIKNEVFEKLRQELRPEKIKETTKKIKTAIDKFFVRYAELPKELQRAFYIYEESVPQVARHIKEVILKEFGEYPRNIREYATLHLENPDKYPAENSPNPEAVKELARKADIFFKQKLEELKEIKQFSDDYKGYFKNKIDALRKEKAEIQEQLRDLDRREHRELYDNLQKRIEDINIEIQKTENLNYIHHYVRNPKLKKRIYLWLKSGLIKGLRVKPKELIGRKFDTIDDLEQAGFEVEKDIAVIVARVERITWESKRNYEFIEELKKYKDFVLKKSESANNPMTVEWVEIPEVASLHGYKVHPAIASAIRELIWAPQYRTPVSKLGKLLRQLNTAMKIARFYKPFLMTYNDIQQYWIGSSLAGKIKFPYYFIKATKEVIQKGELYKQLEKHGLYNRDYTLYRDLLEEEIKAILEKRDKGILYIRLRHALKDIINPMELVKDIYKISHEITWTLDEILRTALAQDYIRAGFSVPDAVDKVNLYMAWYNRLPKSTKYHMNTYLFVFPYRSQMARLYKETIKNTAKGTTGFIKDILKGKGFNQAIGNIKENWDSYRAAVNWLIWKITVSKFLWALGFSGALWGYRYVRKLGGLKETPRGLKYVSLGGPVFEIPKYLSRPIYLTVMYNIAAFPGFIMSLLYNKGWHGKQIYNPFADTKTQLKQIASYSLEMFFPPTTEIKNLKDKEKTVMDKILQLLGIAYIYYIKELTPQQVHQIIKEIELNENLTEEEKYKQKRRIIREFYRQKRKVAKRIELEFKEAK